MEINEKLRLVNGYIYNHLQVRLVNGYIYNGIKNYKSNIKGLGSFFIIFENSANIEYPGYYGISHLIEHCMCEKVKELELEFEKYGISFNACTGSTRVMFFIKGLDEGIIKFRNEFYDRIINYEITEDVFERERSIVIQEYKDALSDQRYVFMENVLRKYFNSRFPCGEMADLENLTYEDFIKYKNLNFSFPRKICNTSRKKCKKNEFITININYNLLDESYFHPEGTNNPLVKGPEVNTCRTVGYFSPFTFDHTDAGMKKFIYNSLLSKYMCYGLTSPLYQELREKTGKVYGISSYVESINEQQYAYWGIILSVDPNYVKEIKEKLLNCLETYINKLDENIFNNVVIGLKNDIKKKNLTSTQNIDSFDEMLLEKTKKFKFDFEEFQQYAKLILKSDYIILSDLEIMKNE